MDNKLKIIEKNNDALLVEISIREFNLFRELESAILISCSKDEIPTLTGWTKSELIEFGNNLSDLANKYKITL